MSFADLGVPARLVERLRARGITEAFPIQEAAIPDALAGRDVVGKAITGSGKTLAFALPLLANLTKARPRKPTALVLVPTRELAAQVQKEIAQLTDDQGRRVICIYGGTSYNVARKALNFGVDVVVACPGRLEDMLEQRGLDLADVTTVVVDEADRMADMGFLPAVRRIVAATSRDRHVMLFSATMGPDVSSLVREFTHDAAIHDVVGDEAPSDVDHYFWRVPRDRRPEITADIIEQYERAIIFTRTKHGADRLARQLGERGISAVPLHGDRSQAQRERALRSVKNGSIQVLVATDVAARGIHIDLLPVVLVAPARRARSSRSWARTSSDRSSDSSAPWASIPRSTPVKTPWRFVSAPSTTRSRPNVSTTVRRPSDPKLRGRANARHAVSSATSHESASPRVASTERARYQFDRLEVSSVVSTSRREPRARTAHAARKRS